MQPYITCTTAPHTAYESQTAKLISRKVFLASGDKPCTDFGSDFKYFSLYRGVVHFVAEHLRRIVVFLQAWHVCPITFSLTSLTGHDSSIFVGFLHILQVNTDEDIVYSLKFSCNFFLIQ